MAAGSLGNALLLLPPLASLGLELKTKLILCTILARKLCTILGTERLTRTCEKGMIKSQTESRSSGSISVHPLDIMCCEADTGNGKSLTECLNRS